MRCDLLVAAAIAVVFAAAVALIIEFEGEGFAAVWTLDFAFVQNGAVDADLFVAVWTFYFVEMCIRDSCSPYPIRLLADGSVRDWEDAF